MTKADPALLDEVEKLRKLSVAELRARYLELFGEETASRNKDFLFKRIVYRMQEKKYGGLTPATIARAMTLAEDAPRRISSRRAIARARASSSWRCSAPTFAASMPTRTSGTSCSIDRPSARSCTTRSA